MARNDLVKKMQSKAKQSKTPQKSWFSNFLRGGIRGSDAPIGLGPRTVETDVGTYVDPLYQDAPAINPQTALAALGGRIAEPTTDLQGAPIAAPVKRQPIRNQVAAQAAPSVYPTQAPERIPLARREAPLGPQRAPLSVHNIMDVDAGSDGYGISW